MLETVQQGQLIDQDSSQGKALSVDQALGRHLAMSIEDTFELLVEGLNRPRTQPMEDAPHFHPVVRVRIRSVLGGDQQMPGLVTRLLYVGRIVVEVAQQEACIRPS